MKKLLSILSIGFLLFASCQTEVGTDNTLKTQTDTTPPFPVKKLTAEEGDKYISLSWLNPADSDFYGTKITFTPSVRNVSQPVIIEGTPSGKSSTTFNGLVNNTEYTFSVTALDKNQNKSEIVTISATPRPDTTPPSEVTNITATPGDKSVTLSWTNPIDSDYVCTRITFTKASNQVTNPITVQGKPGKSSTTTIDGLENETEYTFSLTALDENQNESTLVSIKATPKSQVIYAIEVEDFTVTPRDSSVILSWTNPSDIDFYSIEITANDTKTILDATPSEKQTYTISNLINNNEYTFTIKTIDKNKSKSNGITKNCTPREGYLSLSIKLPNDTIYTDDLYNEKRNIILTTDKAPITITVSSSSSVTNAVWKKSDDTSISTAEELLSDETANILSLESDSNTLEVTENGYYYIAVKNEDGKTAYSYVDVNTIDKTPLDEISHFVATSDGKTIECSWEDARPQSEYDSPLKKLLISYIYDNNVYAPENGEITIDAGVEKASIKIADGKTDSNNLQITIKTVDNLGHISSGFVFKCPCTKYITVTEENYFSNVRDVIENLTEDETILYVYIGNNEKLSFYDLRSALSNLSQKQPDVKIQLDLTNLPENVIEIADYTFSSCKNLSSVKFSDNINRIGKSTFSYCTGLSEIVLPANLLEIEEDTFRGCTNLSKVNFSNKISKIGSYAFYGCTSLSDITLPENLIEISYYAFKNCTNLSSVSFSDKIKIISLSAFENCTSLANIELPDSVEGIYQSAFKGCTSLSSIVIPGSITTMHNMVFDDCTNLSKITIKPGLSYVYLPRTTKVQIYFTGTIEQWCNIEKKTEEGVSDSFYSYDLYIKDTLITEATLNNNIQNISNGAFQYCKSLKKISIPNTVTSIGENAFTQCTELTEAKLPNGLKTIEDGTFWGCSKLQSITIPESVTSIGSNAFRGCSEFSSIVIPDSVTVIGTQAFYNCTNLTEVTIPGDFSITTKYIGDKPFQSLKIKKITYSKCIYENGSLPGCSAAPEEICLKDNVTYIPPMVSSLKKITIPPSVTRIDFDAFYYGCTDLTIDYTGTIQQWCQNISIENLDDKRWFGPWSKRDAKGYVYNCKIFVNGSELIGDIELPEGITKINDYAFSNLKIDSIKLPTTLKTIGKNAFYYCSLRQDIIIPDNVISIGDRAFYYNKLKKITLGKSLKIIGTEAFLGCGGDDILIPASVTKVGANAFDRHSVRFHIFSNTCWYNEETGENLGIDPSNFNPDNSNYYASYPKFTIISDKYTAE